MRGVAGAKQVYGEHIEDTVCDQKRARFESYRLAVCENRGIVSFKERGQQRVHALAINLGLDTTWDMRGKKINQIQIWLRKKEKRASTMPNLPRVLPEQVVKRECLVFAADDNLIE